MFWSCALLNLALTDGEGLFEAPEIWYSFGERYPKMIAYMITKQED